MIFKRLILVVLLFAPTVSFAVDLPEFDCLIEPWQRVDTSFAARGVLSELSVEQSDQISKGQVLARLESGLEEATVNLHKARSTMLEEIRSAKANYDFGQRNLKRISNLYKKKAIPFHKLDEATTELEVAKHRLQQIKDNNRLAKLELAMSEQVLNRRTIKSPITGVVVKNHKSVGEYIEDEPVIQLAQMHPLRVEVLVPVRMFGRITTGMTAKVVPEAPMSGQVREASVVVVDKVVDVASGTFSVQLKLANEDYALPSGLKCSVRFSD